MKSRIRALLAAGLMLYSAVSPAQTLTPPPERPALDENGVDVVSDGFQYSQTLMSIGPKGTGGLDYTVTYSNDTWRNNFTSSYSNTSGDFIQTAENVAVGNISESFTGGISNNHMGSSIGTGGPTTAIYVQRDGTTASFGHLVAESSDPVDHSSTFWTLVDYVTYPNGVTLTFHYRDDFGGGQPAPGSPDQSTRLQSVTSNTGYQVKFNYAVNTITDAISRNQWLFDVTSVVLIDNAIDYCDPDADSCSLAHSWPTVVYSHPAGYTFAVTDAAGNTTSIGGTDTSFFIKTAESSTNNIIYTKTSVFDPCVGPWGGNASKVSNATVYGRSTSYTYTANVSPGNNAVDSTGPSSQHSKYVSEAGNFPCTYSIKNVTDPLNRVIAFQNDGYGRLTRTTLPEQNYVQNLLDGEGNVTDATAVPKPGSSDPTLTEHHHFLACGSVSQKICNQPDTYTDPRGQVTNYTYDSNSGGLASEMKPAPAAGKARPLKLVSWVQKSAYIKNASGTLVAAPAIWVKSSETECQTVAGSNSPVCDSAAPKTVTTYQYGANGTADNLLVRGVLITSGSSSRRTCYGYDMLGRRISETLPNANLTSCP